eukprot:TRINITY_DN8308_c0_g1_i5.p1 TRINITY_DN8308_c0_g1~~TRINITY_DN8308_c0_g1_i5.p1  ORF type:complete len:197 (-),score=33.06 TRINITY_DN8308_c0_g1_i5:71-661(-)
MLVNISFNRTFLFFFFFLMIRRPPRSTHCISSAASDVYKRQYQRRVHGHDRYANPVCLGRRLIQQLMVYPFQQIFQFSVPIPLPAVCQQHPAQLHPFVRSVTETQDTRLYIFTKDYLKQFINGKNDKYYNGVQTKFTTGIIYGTVKNKIPKSAEKFELQTLNPPSNAVLVILAILLFHSSPKKKKKKKKTKKQRIL